jgi:pimeloyl-ACP methyl ester carboxylesterase
MAVTKKDWRVPLAKMSGGFHLASDPELDKQIRTDPRALAAFNSFPFPGGAQAFFVNTIKRVSKIAIPTMILWGEDDKLDPPETGRLLFAALRCKKILHIIPGNGHVGHLDRHKQKVFSLTADWMLENLA